jgi:hypothetical protein
MTTQDYKSILDGAMTRLGELLNRKEDIEVEISKTRQFVRAAIHMLSDEQRAQFFKEAYEGANRANVKESSLADAIRDVLCETPKTWFTVAEIRDSLVNKNFDFSHYTSNPLASVSTTAKRLAPKEAETTELDGVIAYRWKSAREAKLRLARRSYEKIFSELIGEDWRPFADVPQTDALMAPSQLDSTPPINSEEK